MVNTQQQKRKTMIIKLSNGGAETCVNLDHGTEVGHVRTLEEEREDVGAPSSYTLAVNGVGVEDSHILRDGDVVTFRPRQGEKG